MEQFSAKDYFEFRTIPSYPRYSINRLGTIRDDETLGFVGISSNADGYMTCWLLSYTSSKKTMVLVHRLVAETWLNPPKDKFKVEINHINGNKADNHVSNLEWVTKAENAEHAAKYLNPITSVKRACLTRDFYTGEILEHPTLREAGRYMGVPGFDRPGGGGSLKQLFPKLFGKLVKGRYEVKLKDDKTPWFYEKRKDIATSRYRVVIEYPNHQTKEYYDYRRLLKDFKLYGIEGGFHGIVNELRRQYPEYRITLEDAYELYNLNGFKTLKEPLEQGCIFLVWEDKIIILPSLREAERVTGVGRKKLAAKIDTLEKVNGFIVLKEDLELYQLYQLRDKFLDDKDEPKEMPSIIVKLLENSI